jgi:hypothetical protein
MYIRKRRIRGGRGTIMLPTEQWWNPGGNTVEEGCTVAGWVAKGASSFEQSLVDVGTGGHDLTVGDQPAWHPDYGWRFNRSRQNYLISDIVPESDYTYVFRFAGLDTSVANSVFGSYSATNQSQIDFWPLASVGMVWYYGAAAGVYTPVATEGVFGLAADQPYRGGVADNGPLAWSGWTEAASAIYLGAVNDNGTPDWFCTVDLYAMGIYSCTLTATQMMIISHALMGL